MADEKFLNIRQVSDITGLSRSRVYELVADGVFPPGVKLGSRCTRWPSSEVQAWLQARIRERDERLAEIEAKRAAAA